MTKQEAEHVSMSIFQNEAKNVSELDDYAIMAYLLDHGFEDSDENVALVRSV